MACSARTSKVHEGILYENEIKRLNFVVQLQINIMWTGYTKTYVWLSGTGRNLRVVWTRQPLAWIVWSTSTFSIRKNKETVENCLQIMVELISNLKSHKSKPHTSQNKFKYSFWLCHSTVISFVFYQLHFSFKSKTIYKGNSVIKNIKCLIVFEFWVSN